MKSPFVRFGAVAIALASLVGAGSALAQSSKPSNSPAGQAAAPQPIKLDLIPMQQPWTKVCQKEPNGPKEFCRTIRAFGQAADQPPTLALAIDQLTGESKRMFHVQLPEGLLIRPGFRLVLDGIEPIEGHYSICASGSCFAEAELNNAALNALKKSQIAAIIVRNQTGADVTFNVPMHDFAAAFDGPAVDPKVIEQQNKALQDKLEEQARKQREQIEKQQAPATPAPKAK